MLTRIMLQNWRSHSKTELKLKEGANIFLGQMGSGKSSVMDALCFCLYGTYPKLSRRDAKLEDVRNFRHQKEEVAVEVEWEEGNERGTNAGNGKGNRKFKVRRELFSASAWFYCDGKLFSKGPKAVSEEVEKTLQIPYELFARAVYAEQNRLDYWLALPAGSRKAELDRLLGLDKFEQARAGAIAEVNRLKEKAGEIEKEIDEKKIGEARQKVGEGKEKMGELKEEIEKVRKEIESLSLEFENEKKEFEKLEKEYKKSNELAMKLQKLEGAISSLEKNISDGEKLPELKMMEQRRADAAKKRETLENELKGMEKSEHELAVSIGKLNASIKNAQEGEKKLAELYARQKNILKNLSIESIRTELAKAETEHQQMLSQEASLDSQIEDVKKIIEALKVHGEEKEGHECPVCRQGLDEKKRKQLEEENTARKEALEKAAAKNRESIANAKKNLKKLSETDAEASRLEAQMQTYVAKMDVASLERELDAKEKMLDEARKDKHVKNLKLKDAANEETDAKMIVEKIGLAEKFKKQVQEAKAQREEVKKEIELLAFSKERHSASSKKCNELGAKKASMAEKSRGSGALLENMQKMQNEIEKSLVVLEKKKEDALKMRKEIGELESFRQVLIATQGMVRSQLIGEINLAMQKLWPIIYPYGDWNSLRLNAGEKDYEVQIFQGEWKALEAHASGGERACLGLCLRASLSILLTPHLGWLILDEPTHNLDSEAVGSLGKALSEKMPKIIPQIIVITHEPRLLESTPARVFRFARDKLKGEDTRVEAEGE